MKNFKELLSTMLNTDNVTTAKIELKVDRYEFIKTLSDLSVSFEINEKFCNSNDWELTFNYRGLGCDVAIHSWVMFGDEVKVLVLVGEESKHYYSKTTRNVLEDTSMYQYHIEKYNLV